MAKEQDKSSVEAPDETKLTDWENPPKLADLKADFQEAQSAHTAHVTTVDRWISALNGDQQIKAKAGRSKIVPKLIRKQAEWRYSSLSEPFLSTDDLFNAEPVTFEDKKAAYQSGLVLNHQVNTKIDKVKFIDEYVRTAVDEGTAIVRVGWEYEDEEVEVEVPIIEQRPVLDPQQAMMMQQQGLPPVMEVEVGRTTEIQTKVIKNHPTLEVCDYNNVIVDPTCNGDLNKAEFVIYSFETSKAQLKRDGRYKNLDYINYDNSSALAQPDHESGDDSNFKFNDEPRKKVIAYEYWGYWDINDTGEVEPFVATWVGDTLIRMEANPFPDKKIPFVLVQYLPKRKAVYGEPDGALLEDNQKIIGAVTRGMIDIIGRSANGQMGIRKDALDVTNARKFERGEDYKFNSNVDPRQAFHMETYPEIPGSALNMLNLQNNEAESLTGIKAFTGGISGQALGSTATGIRSALDATSKRELGILRRLADGMKEIGRKIMSMNAEFLDETEIVRITNEEFIEITRDDLNGRYDIKLNISTAEADDQKAQELSFMLQTMGNNMDPSMSQMILADIAQLRKMPELAKKIRDYQPQPDPMMQQKAQLELKLLEAQIANEMAKAQENSVDVAYKQAKTATEQAKARGMHSKSDLDDLDFVNREAGIADLNKEEQMKLKHQQDMEKAMFERDREIERRELDNPATAPTGAPEQAMPMPEQMPQEPQYPPMPEQ